MTMADDTAAAPVAATPAKPGYQTTEFWLSLASVVFSTLLSTGVIPHASEVLGVVSAAGTLLVALGYTWARSWIKS
jgi:hypothetical protein